MKTIKLLCSVAIGMAAMPINAKTLTIGVDLSGSNPVILSSTFAQAAGGYVRDRIAKLLPGDVLVVRTFGDRGMANIAAERIQISRHNRADKTAAKVAGFVASLPSRNIDGQGSTNIVSFFEFGQFDCTSGGEVLLLTDGIESSEYVTGLQFLGGKPLPAPDKGLLSGCNVTMFGLGQSADVPIAQKEVKTIRAAWVGWMKAAGAKFSAVINQ
jgi:hypothetical protein